MSSTLAIEPIHCSISGSSCCFLTCIQVSQEAGTVIWYSHLSKNFPVFLWSTQSKALEKTWCWEKTEGRRRGRQRMRWLDGITDFCTWVWASSRRWWRTRKPGMLQSMGLQTWTQLSDWTTTTRWLLLHKETLNTLAIVPTTEFARQLKLASFLTCIFKSWSCLSSDNWKFGGGCFFKIQGLYL